MNLAVRVIERRNLVERRRASIDWDAAGVGVHNETVVNIWLLFAKCKDCLGTDVWIRFNWSGRDASVVDHLVLVGDQTDFCTSNGRCAGEIEVTGGDVSKYPILRYNAMLPVIRHVDGSLVDFIANQLSLVFNM